MLPPASMAFNLAIGVGWLPSRLLWNGTLLLLAALLATARPAAGHSAVKQVIRQGRERLASGLNVVIYPEGTRLMPGADQRQPGAPRAPRYCRPGLSSSRSPEIL